MTTGYKCRVQVKDPGYRCEFLHLRVLSMKVAFQLVSLVVVFEEVCIEK